MREKLRNRRPIDKVGVAPDTLKIQGWGDQSAPPILTALSKKSRACHERKQVVVQAVSKPSYVEELSQIVQVLSEHGSF